MERAERSPTNCVFSRPVEATLRDGCGYPRLGVRQPAINNMETFIELVRSFPCLWNPQHPDYRELVVRDLAWDQVVKKCNNSAIKDIRIARAEWKRLRDNHREALKRAKLGQNKLLPAQITTWKYAKAMQFLEPFMKYRITEDIEIESQTSNSSNKQSEQDVSTTDIDMVKRENIHKRKCTEYANDSVRSHEHGDALETFFECILKSTREMPPWMQTQVKKKIFAVIIEAEEHMSFQDMPTSRQHLIFETKIKTETPE